MKTVIFFLFSFISYVFAGAVGPLGLAAQMPPYRPLDGEYHLNINDDSAHHTLYELFLFLSGGSGQNCERSFQDVCEDLKKTYGETPPKFDFVLDVTCEDSQRACARLSQVRHELCDVAGVTYENLIKRGPLNSTICMSLYRECRIRTAGCSSEFRRQCHRVISKCHDAYGLALFSAVFLNTLRAGVSSPIFEQRLGELCRSLSTASDTLIQLCLNPSTLKDILKDYVKNKELGRGNFDLFPDLDTGAFLKARGLDGDLFLPVTQPNTSPTYLLGFLIGGSGFTSFSGTCADVTKKCMGLSFFPQTAPFCDANSHQASNIECQQAEIELGRAITTIKEGLKHGLHDGDFHKVSVTGGVDSDLCKNYLIDCSYLKRLDPDLSYLCDFLKDYCSYSLEIASSLSIFEYFFRNQNKGKDSSQAFETCQKDLANVCYGIPDSSLDFVLFCYRPGHTCTALKELTRLRCEGYKKKFDVDPLTEGYCLNLAFEYEPYMHWCPHSDSSIDFFTKCYTEFPENKYLKDILATTLKDLIKLEEDAKAKVDDGF